MNRVSFDPDEFAGSLLTAAVSHPGDDVSRIALAGDLDRDSAAQLIDMVLGTLEPGRPRSIVLDLAGVRFFDVGGARAVAAAQSYCAAADCRLELENPSPFVRRVLEITGVWNTGAVIRNAELLRALAEQAAERAGEIRRDNAALRARILRARPDRADPGSVRG